MFICRSVLIGNFPEKKRLNLDLFAKKLKVLIAQRETRDKIWNACYTNTY